MGKEVLAEISIKGHQNTLLRILPDFQHPGLFAIDEAGHEALDRAIAEGKPFNWQSYEQTYGYTTEALEHIITDKFREALHKTQ